MPRPPAAPPAPPPQRVKPSEEGPTVPVSGADPLPPPKTATRAPVPVRHADFTSWQPPEEEGDDEPILRDIPEPAAREREPVRERESAREREPAREREVVREVVSSTSASELDAARGAEGSSGDYAEVFVSVGRRDGVRAGDLQSLLLDQIGLDKADVKRIRVRERNAFVSVRRSELQRAVSGLSGATLHGLRVMAEPARERGAGGSDIDPDGASANEA